MLYCRNVNWTAPEILTDTNSHINEKADVWSLSMVIFEILTGEVPFDIPAIPGVAPPHLFDFAAELYEGKRPELPVHITQDPSLKWIVDMVSFLFFVFCTVCCY